MHKNAGRVEWCQRDSALAAIHESFMAKKRLAAPEHADTLSLKALRELVTGPGR